VLESTFLINKASVVLFIRQAYFNRFLIQNKWAF